MNEQAEEILLGTILKDNSILDEIILSPEHFLDLTNRNIYKAMLGVKKKGFPIDGASLKDELGETGFLFIGGNERLLAYKNCVPSVHAFKSYERMVINQWKISTTRELIQTVLESEMNVEGVQTLIKDLSKVDEEVVKEGFDLKTHLVELYSVITTPIPMERSGIESGYADIENKTDGFRGNDLVIVGARPSMGKTAFMLNLAKNASKKSNAKPVIFSLEMKAEALVKRLLSCLSEVDGMKMKNIYNYTNDDEKTKMINALGTFDELGLEIFDESKQTVAEMRARVRKIKRDNPDKKIIVFIDYLTKITPSQNYKGNMHMEITEISSDLKAMAKDFDVPVICLAQLSRDVERRSEKRPLMSDLRESGSIEQDADIIMMLYRDEYYKETTDENRNVLEVDILKNRDGVVGLVKLQYKKEINKIENLYHYHNAKNGH